MTHEATACLDSRTLDDMAWRYREHMHEEIGRVMRHGMYAQQYLEDGLDMMSTFHLTEMKRCLKAALRTHNELVALEGVHPPTTRLVGLAENCVHMPTVAEKNGGVS